MCVFLSKVFGFPVDSSLVFMKSYSTKKRFIL